MKGQLIKIPTSSNDGIIYGFDNKVYYFIVGDIQKNVVLTIGHDVEFEPYKKTPFYKPFHKTYVKITDSYEEKITKTIDDVLVTSESVPEQHNIVEIVKSYHIFAEAETCEQAMQALVKLAKETKANAILKTKLIIVFTSINSILIYRYEGIPARITPLVTDDNEVRNQKQNGLFEKNIQPQMQINPHYVRKISPNLQLKYLLRGIMLVFIMLFLPLAGQLISNYCHIVPPVVSVPISIFIFICAILIFIHINPTRCCAYFRSDKKK